MMHQTVFDTSELLHQLGIAQVVICPGSRNAPLIISFVQNPNIEKISVIDERSAGFVALGLAQSSSKPVVVCCTSGSAVLNFGPACAEAFYQEVPIIFISADRPPEWIDQGDGQTIRQSRVLEPHVKQSLDLPVDLGHPDAQWEYRRKLNEAVNKANSGIKGPVHVNIPFREPFYPTDLAGLQFSKKLQVTKILDTSPEPSPFQKEEILKDWSKFEKKIFVLGQGIYGPEFLSTLNLISRSQHIPIIADVISNAGVLHTISKQDLFLVDEQCQEVLRPDLVVTFGKTLISKNLKLTLRGGVEHWSVGVHRPIDTFRSLSKVFPWEPTAFLSTIAHADQQPVAYENRWKQADQVTHERLEELTKEQPLSEFWVFRELMANLPRESHVHLSNSMAVRYANFFTPTGKEILFHCNRGTSGIDGPVSTAVGYSNNSEAINIMITGDLSALYDRNAFLNNLSPRLKVIVSNNGGGGIFDLIPGPKVLANQDRTKFFETRHDLSFERLADEINFDYTLIRSKEEFAAQLHRFMLADENGLMEIKTDSEINGEVYRKIKGSLNEKSPFGDS